MCCVHFNSKYYMFENIDRKLCIHSNWWVKYEFQIFINFGGENEFSFRRCKECSLRLYCFVVVWFWIIIVFLFQIHCRLVSYLKIQKLVWHFILHSALLQTVQFSVYSLQYFFQILAYSLFKFPFQTYGIVLWFSDCNFIFTWIMYLQIINQCSKAKLKPCGINEFWFDNFES